jgi:hypothetical protein
MPADIVRLDGKPLEVPLDTALPTPLRTGAARLATAIARPVIDALKREPCGRDQVYIALNGIAVVLAFVLDVAENRGCTNAEQWFDEALEKNRNQIDFDTDGSISDA